MARVIQTTASFPLKRFLAALAVGGLLVVVLELAAPHLLEAFGDTGLAAAGIAMVLVALVLLGWAIVGVVGSRRTGAIALASTAAVCATIVLADSPLFDLGVRLNFELHRPTYDALVLEMKTGRLLSGSSGVRSGVRYAVSGGGQAIAFNWSSGPTYLVEITYSEITCPPKPGQLSAAGKPISGHYCLLWGVV